MTYPAKMKSTAQKIHFRFRTLESQIIIVLTVSLLLLQGTFIFTELKYQQSVFETAQSTERIEKIRSIKPLLEIMENNQIDQVISYFSRCHEGYVITDSPYPVDFASDDTDEIVDFYENQLSMGEGSVYAGHKLLTQDQFAYSDCRESIKFPVDGLVVSLYLASGKWLNFELHPHGLHVDHIFKWLLISLLAFIFIVINAIVFIRITTKPLNNLNFAAQQFAKGLKVEKVKESGPQDIRDTIRSFNSMQKQVVNQLKNRNITLASISHDIRTPLTALRIKAELIDDFDIRNSLITSIQKMEKIITSGLDFLKGENTEEAIRKIDLAALVESECCEFSESGKDVKFITHNRIILKCRPIALVRALRNLIENAVKYASAAIVEIKENGENVEIIVTDKGQGIPKEKLDKAIKPFKRLSSAREGSNGGFGLGLSIVKAIVDGHGGNLILKVNNPTGLIVVIQLPKEL